MNSAGFPEYPNAYSTLLQRAYRRGRCRPFWISGRYRNATLNAAAHDLMPKRDMGYHGVQWCNGAMRCVAGVQTRGLVFMGRQRIAVIRRRPLKKSVNAPGLLWESLRLVVHGLLDSLAGYQ